ncbi:MAG: GGDEF domain-containing protein [Cryobacterium sp.]|uniref:tetratricopeptide repeat-containing diguanylate cyclase n=1 Tax=unclassified Cryobacterium TaxID=2649013 RepID=UPI0018CB7465|nr:MULTISPECIES: GGDEF domain-containing protein [unclassified Cryobacterium]MCY7404759.1 GGDEF domain-containing protein [Cryobacterium sp.]MEC5153636.1 diguanylate cyclase (GGDEF)-like protein [Cryobacterium sp. CAN_C3]
MSVDDLLSNSKRASSQGEHCPGADQAEEALARPEATPWQQAIARELLTLHRLRLGDYQASVKQGLLALEYFTASGDLLAQSNVHCTLALAFSDTALNEAALHHVLGAIEAARACANPTAEFWALSRSSLVHGAMGDAVRSVELGKQALALAEALHDPETSFTALNNLGDTYLTIARARLSRNEDASQPFKDGLVLMREAVGLAQEQENPFQEAIARTNLVSLLIGLGRYDEAREQGRQGKVLAKVHGYRSLEVDIDAQLAEMVRADGCFDEATAMMEAQLADPDVNDEPALLAKLHRSLYEMHKAGGRFAQSLAHHERLHAVTLLMTVQTAGLQAQMLINTIEIEQARHEVEKSQLEVRMERLRAEELDDQANTDPLTRLSNRRALDRELPWMMGRAEKGRRPLCAAMIDFDHFKQVNDDHGHAAGDQVLTVMASMLRTITRGTDLAVRVGGEEFLLVFAETSLAEATAACERLLTSIRGYDWESLAPGLTCTVSAGVAALEPHESVSVWLSRADSALYEAKHNGRDRVHAAKPDAATIC